VSRKEYVVVVGGDVIMGNSGNKTTEVEVVLAENGD
jgi:hypothetical protein